MAVTGATQLRARWKAIGLAFKPLGKKWADDTVHLAQARVAVRTGATRRSIRRKSATQKRAVVEARWGARFIEHATRGHDIKPHKARVLRWEASGTIFAKRVHHPGTRAQPFLEPAAKESLRKNPMRDEVLKAWNQAA